ncbi:MAG TPA: hypothetical protein ENH10_03420 [Bacteroidetes bacterium]|nr:hypothetical protein [Bacteroidota bacterium]HEX04191.1 hypothetical protein [Bacteroidota bacterium]
MSLENEISIWSYLPMIVSGIIVGVVLFMIDAIIKRISRNNVRRVKDQEHNTSILDQIHENSIILDRAREIVVIDIKRAGQYPNYNIKSIGVSSSLKIGYVGAGSVNGVELLIQHPLPFIYDSEKRCYVHKLNDSSTDTSVTLFPIGTIALESIEHIDWNGDEYEGLPRFFVNYKRFGKGPWSRIEYCESQMSRGRYHYTKVRYPVLVQIRKWGYPRWRKYPYIL